MTMKMALLGFYSEEMIHNSKMKLMKLAAETGVDIREVKETRQNTAGRTAREKEVDDILNIMKQIDENEDANVIEFYAKDVKLMPPASPESGSSNMCLLEVVNNQNQKIAELTDSIARMMVIVNNNKQQITDITSSKQSRMRSSDAIREPVQQTQGDAQGERPQHMGAANPGPSQDPVPAVLQEFMPAGPRGGKRPNKGATAIANVKNKTKPNKGTADSADSLQAGPVNFYVQVTNVRPDVTTEAVSTYIEQKTNQSVKEISIEDTSTDGWTTKRFLIKFDIKDTETILDDSFWPSSIYYKRWYPPRSKNNSQKL